MLLSSLTVWVLIVGCILVHVVALVVVVEERHISDANPANQT